MGTNEDELNRVVISRCEVDMIQIKEEYESLMKRSLEKHISVRISRIEKTDESNISERHERRLQKDSLGIDQRSESTDEQSGKR